MQPTHRRLRIVAFAYGFLYFLFIAAATIPATRSAIFSNPQHPSFGLELAMALMLFALFVVGLLVWSPSELGAGLLFLIWYAEVCWDDRFSERYGMGGGAGPVLAIPGLLIGLVLVAAWVLSRFHSPSSGNPPGRD